MPQTTREESRLLKRGVAALFDAAIAGWSEDRIEAIGRAVKRGPNVVEVKEDGTLTASVNGQTIFISSEYEVLALGARLEGFDDEAA